MRSLWATSLVLILALLASLPGCGKASPEPQSAPAAGATDDPSVQSLDKDHQLVEVGGQRLIVAKDQPVTVEIRRKNATSNGGTKYRETAESKTAGLRTSSDQVAQTLKSDKAEAHLIGGGGAIGGGFNYSGKLFSGSSLNIFHLIGAFLLLAALGLFIAPKVLLAFGIPMTPQNGTAIALAAGGVVFICVGVVVNDYPWAALIALAALVGLIVFWVIRGIVHGKDKADLKKTKTAVKKIVKGVDALPEAEKTAVKASVEQAAGDQNNEVREVVAKAKSELAKT